MKALLAWPLVRKVSLPALLAFVLPICMLHACSGDVLVAPGKKDATRRSPDGGCDFTPTTACSKKDAPACFGQAGSDVAVDPVLTRLDPSKGVPIGCSYVFPSPKELPRTFECYIEARCDCLDKGFGPQWECHH